MMKIFCALTVATIGLAGCAGLSEQEQQAVTGGAAGVAGGAALGALAGDAALGAALGGATGTAAGALWEDVERRF